MDVVLCGQIPDVSRANIQRLIKAGEITLNGNPAKANTLLSLGDELTYPTLLMETPEPKSGPAPMLDILYQDRDILIIDKPAGLLVHQATMKDSEPTVVDALLERFPEIIHVGDDPVRPGIVHRLDKDVSGVMTIAKTQDAFENLKSQFKDRTAKKEYLALAYGDLPKDHDEIRLRIARSKARGRMVARPESQEGKEAITMYDVLERFKNTTYARVQILTGRTHQIRAHFKAIDHPLVGDKLYAKKNMKNIRPIELDRIFLHAHKLTIKLMDGKEKSFISELPSDLQKILNTLPKS